METTASPPAAGMTDVRPNLLQPCVTVDVYLPKNLLNTAVLIDLLKETIEFRPAKRYLLKHAATLLTEFRAPSVTPNYHDALRSEPSPPSLEAFKKRLGQIRKCIKGYSIFEVDGAFDKVTKSSVIPTGPEKHYGLPRPSPVDQHFDHCAPDFVDALSRRRSKLSRKNATLHPHPSDNNYRVLEHGDDRLRLQRTAKGFAARRCLTLIEERVLMIRFITMPTKEDQSAQPVPGFSVWQPGLDKTIARVLWDTLMLAGCFFARRLGTENSKIEDEIWITYDIGALWIWQNGTSMLTSTQEQSV